MWAERLSLPSVIAPAPPVRPFSSRTRTDSVPASVRATNIPRDPRRRRDVPGFFSRHSRFLEPGAAGEPEREDGHPVRKGESPTPRDRRVPKEAEEHPSPARAAKLRPAHQAPEPAVGKELLDGRRGPRRKRGSCGSPTPRRPRRPYLGGPPRRPPPCVPRRGGDPPELPQHHGVAVDRTRIIRQFTSDEWCASPVWARKAWSRSIVPVRPPEEPAHIDAPGENRIPWMPPRSAARWSCRRQVLQVGRLDLHRRAGDLVPAAWTPVSLPAASIRATSRADDAPIRSRPALRCTPGSRRRTPQGKCLRARERRPIFPRGRSRGCRPR